MKNEVRKETYNLLNLLCSSQLVLESLDELQNTTFYKHRFKMISNRFVKELEKTTKDHLIKCYNSDEEITNMLINSMEKLGEHLSLLSPDEIIIFVETLKNERDG